MSVDRAAPMSLRQALCVLQVEAEEKGHPGIAKAAAILRRTLVSRQAIRFCRELAQPVTVAPEALPDVPPEALPPLPDIPLSSVDVSCPTCEQPMFSMVDMTGHRAYFCGDCDVSTGGQS